MRKIKRFSYQEGINSGLEYINSQVDNSLEKTESISEELLKNENIKPSSKKWIKLVNDVSYLLRRKKKKDNDTVQNKKIHNRKHK